MVEQSHEVLAELFVGGVLSVETVLVVFDDRQLMLLKDSESFRGRQAAIDGVKFNKGVEEDGDLVVLDQMLVLRVSTVLPDQSSAREISLQLLNLIFLLIFKQTEPSIRNQPCKSVPLALVQFDIKRVLDKNRHIFRRNHPLISEGEVADLRILTVSLVESEQMHLGHMFGRQLLVARKDVLYLREDCVVKIFVFMVDAFLIFLNDGFD